MEKKITNYRKEAIELFLSNPDLSSYEITTQICNTYGLEKKRFIQ